MYHFMLIPQHGDAVASILDSYTDPNTPRIFGEFLAKKILNRRPDYLTGKLSRPELMPMFEKPQEWIDVVVIENRTQQAVRQSRVQATR